jgi:isochorismate pyruvate lyase
MIMAMQTPDDLERVRAEIDSIDTQIVELIAQRQRQVEAAGRLKSDQSAVRAPDRVEKVIGKVRSLAQTVGADPGVVERTYRSMIAAFIDLELTVHQGHVESAAD